MAFPLTVLVDELTSTSACACGASPCSTIVHNIFCSTKLCSALLHHAWVRFHTAWFADVRQWDGPSIHLDRATFDCSPANYRNFWHALKLREVLHARLGVGLGVHAPLQDRIVLMNRNTCGQRSKGNKCHGGRGVQHHDAISAALRARFLPRGVHTIDFTGTEPYHEQAREFHRAAVVVGPHGAQLANIIFCQKNAAVVEFVAARRTNSALYAGYASSVFGLSYWVVVGNASNGAYDDITPHDVVDVVGLALEHRLHRGHAHGHHQHSASGAGVGATRRGSSTVQRTQHTAATSTASSQDGASVSRDNASSAASMSTPAVRPWQLLVGDEESNLVTGYGSYVRDWPAGWRRR